MQINTGTFHNYRAHHPKWFSVFYFGNRKIVEIWFGNKYLVIHR